MSVLLLCSISTRSAMQCYADSSDISVSGTSAEGIRISSTPLVVDTIASYDGMFCEDGSDREVVGVAAIMLRNCSAVTIPYANVVVYTENCRYEFEGTMLPPESSVLIPELNGIRLTEKKIIDCFGWVTVSGSEQPDNVQISATDQISVSNRSLKPVENLLVYHRTFLHDGNFYLGGKAFATAIPYLAPGECITLLPEHYAPGYSKVVWCAVT